jgi:hypothetical protein
MELKIKVPASVSLEELARIIDEYEGYTIYITDEFDEETDFEW